MKNNVLKSPIIPVWLTTMITFALLIVQVQDTEAQLPRERVEEDRKIEFIFPATSNISLATVTPVSSGNLNMTVMHIFGPVDGGIDRFFGLDDGANTRIGFEFGLTDRFSAGIGRMSFHNLIDLNLKYHPVRQTRNNRPPVDVALSLRAAVNTTAGLERGFYDRQIYNFSAHIAHKTGAFTFQLSPMLTHFNHTPGNNEQTLYAVGTAVNYNITDRFSAGAEFIPVIGNRNTGTENALGFTFNIDTGGHLFQIFVTSSQWLNESFVLANNTGRFWDGDIHLGFNIHRAFSFR